MVERDKSARLEFADLEQDLVACSPEIQIPHRHDVMARGSQQFQPAPTEIFVKLELHAT